MESLFNFKARIGWIDIAKALGIFFIVLGHVYEDTTILRIILYLFHVPLFFLLSGITYKYYSNQKEFIIKKIKQLYIPYIIVSIISIFIYLGLGRFIGEDVGLNFHDILRSLYYMIYANTNYGVMMWNRPLWFIPALLVALIITNLLEALKSRTVKNIVAVLLTAIGMVLCYSRIFLPLQFESALAMIIWVYLGINLKPYLNKSKVNISFKWIIIIILMIIAGIYIGLINGSISVMSDQYGSYFPLYYVSAFLLSMATIFISMMIKNNRVFEIVGQNTLFILLWHKFPILLCQKVIPGLDSIIVGENFLLKNIVSIIIALIAIALCIFGQVILRWLGEKTKLSIFTYFANM